jgi:RHS repeat-associated protein
LGTFKHMFNRKESPVANFESGRPPVFENLEPRIYLSADSLLSCLNTPDRIHDPLSDNNQQAIEYDHVELLETNISEVQIQKVEREGSADSDLPLVSDSDSSTQLLSLTLDDSNIGSETEARLAETLDNFNNKNVGLVDITTNKSIEIQSAFIADNGNMPVYKSDADLSIQYATSIKPRGPPTSETCYNEMLLVKASANQNDLTLRIDTDTFTIFDNTQGLVLVNQLVKDIGRVQIQGSDYVNETLTIDLSAGLPSDLDIEFDGGKGGFDSLVLIGNSSLKADYTAIGTDSGTIKLSDQQTTATIAFTNLEPVTVSDLTDYTFTTTGGADTITIDSPAPGQNRISGTSGGIPFESVTFFDVTNLTIDTGTNDASGDDADSITIIDTGLVASGLQTLTILTGQGDDIVNIIPSAAVTISIDCGTGWDQLSIGPQTNTVSLGTDSILVAGSKPITYTSATEVISVDDDVVVSANATLNAREYYLNSLTITNNSILTLASDLSATGFKGVKIATAVDLTIDSSSSISADGKGYGEATGPGAPSSFGLGAGYGGAGGGNPGSTYGSLTEPTYLGSGGGTSYYPHGGAGGGLIRLTVNGNLTVDGTLTANGLNGAQYYAHISGGGSGGSIYIIANIISGTGMITANGGGSSGGSGGGGRIAVYYDTNTFVGTISAYGGTTGQVGGAGTIYINGPGDAPFVTSDSYPKGYVPTTNRIDIEFSRVIDSSTFTIEDVELWGPSGRIVLNAPTIVKEIAGRQTYRFNVSLMDGRYILRIGPEIVGLNGLPVLGSYECTFVVDTVAPRITKQSPAGDIAGILDHIDVWFSEEINPDTFMTTNVVFAGPGGSIAPLAISEITKSVFRVSFDPQNAFGEYNLQIEPKIRDRAGNLIDQDSDGSPGERYDDVYRGSANLVDVDLTITDIVVGATQFWAGEFVNVSWQGRNNSGLLLLGDWTDAVYISQNDKWDIWDVQLATVRHTGGLAEGESYSQSADIIIPGMLPSSYSIIVRADLFNQEKETGGESNNVLVTDEIPLDVRVLPTDGSSVAGSLDDIDTDDYYALYADAGQCLVIRLNSSEANDSIQLLVDLERIPTQTSNLADWIPLVISSNEEGRELVLSKTVAGTYYIEIHGDQLTSPLSYDLTAEIHEIILTDISPNSHGSGSQCTVTLKGGGFDRDTTVSFIDSNGASWVPTETNFISTSTLTAVLDLPNWQEDVYDVVVSNPGVAPYELSDAFVVTAARGGHFEADLIAPGNWGYAWPATIYIEYSNTGNESIPAPLLKVYGSKNAILTLDPSLAGQIVTTSNYPNGTSDTVIVIAAGSGATPGILQPGDSGRIPIYYLGILNPTNLFKVQTVTFELSVIKTYSGDWKPIPDELSLMALNATASSNPQPVPMPMYPKPIFIDWEASKEQMRPEWMASETWEAVYENLQGLVGNTWDDFLDILDQNLNYLSEIDWYESYEVTSKTYDAGELWMFEVEQAMGVIHPVKFLAGGVDLYSETPGISLVFGRLYGQSIPSRYELGSLGRGWRHNWDIYVCELSNHDVIIHGPLGFEFDRYFSWDGTSYVAAPGDYGTLTFADGAYHLVEKDGLVWQFRVDKTLDYVEDTNGNRVTCGYTGGLLTSLTHTNGSQLLIEYDSNNRISQVVDPRGPGSDDDYIVTYEYDASGEYLLDVTSPGNRSTSFTYYTGNDIILKHALTSVTSPDRLSDYFAYRSGGWLYTVYRETDMNEITYTRNRTGTFSITDSTGGRITLSFGPNGQALIIRDGQGNTINANYDRNDEISLMIGPDGQRYDYWYDAFGNMEGIWDPTGQVTHFSYEPTYNNLSTFTDARGNTIDYDYDANGNLLSVTYEDDTRESFTYDGMGNVLTWTNRRGVTVTYTYNTDGQMTSKDYPDTPGVDYLYSYDPAGNMVSATSPSGTITMVYDPDTDWLTRIEYPDGYWFTFDYDNFGRRTRRTDQDGKIVNYIYDNLGQLDQMTDTTGALIVDYDYDIAGRLTRKTLGNGVYTDYDYDSIGQLISLVNHREDDSILSRFDYTYDASGNRTSMTTLDGTYFYGYDLLGQLTSVTYPDGHIVNYTYDVVGNRIEIVDDGVATAYTTNNINQYTYVGDTTYAYDDDGNMISKTESGVTTLYTYDIENRLIAVITPTDTWTYTYDALGNRFASSHNGVATKYVVDPIGFGDVAVEYDDTGTPIAYYDHGLGLLSRAKFGGDAAYYTFDAIGSTSELTDSGGTVLNSYSYDPFGVSLAKYETVSNPFEYVGEYGVMNEINGLEFMRARHYDPYVGRFVRQDPIGLLASDVNLYRYGYNDPLTNVDPSGFLSEQEELELIQGTVSALIIEAKGRGIYVGPVANFLYVWFGSTDQWICVDWQTNVMERLSGLDLHHWSAMEDYWYAGYQKWPYHAFVTITSDTGKQMRIDPWLHGSVLIYRGNIDFPQTLIDSNWGYLLWWYDPNMKTSPAGSGEAHFVQEDSLLSYAIYFENESDATAPAHSIRINDSLDENLDLNTFELKEIAFANQTILVPAGLNHYETMIELDNGLVCQIDAHLDFETRELILEIKGLDPETGWLPEDIMLGILYPNNETGRGEGHISYIVYPKAGLPSGTEITNEAAIVFDWNAPINTPEVLNTIDAGLPISQVNPLPPYVSDTEFLVSWFGEDDVGGSSIASYDILVSDNGAPYAFWKDDTTDTSATFTGQNGHTYTFYSMARDNVGHIEDLPSLPDAFTSVVITSQYVCEVDIYPNRTPNQVFLDKNYTIYVAVYGSSEFDVTKLDSATIRFGRSGIEASPVRAPMIRDLNGDGFADALYGFMTFDCGFQTGDTSGILTGETIDNIQIEGTDSVLITTVNVNMDLSNIEINPNNIPNQIQRFSDINETAYAVVNERSGFAVINLDLPSTRLSPIVIKAGIVPASIIRDFNAVEFIDSKYGLVSFGLELKSNDTKDILKGQTTDEIQIKGLNSMLVRAIMDKYVLDTDFTLYWTSIQISLDTNNAIFANMYGNSTFDVTDLDSLITIYSLTGDEDSLISSSVTQDLNADGFIDALYYYMLFNSEFKLGGIKGFTIKEQQINLRLKLLFLYWCQNYLMYQ